jgi:hypothetical protein
MRAIFFETGEREIVLCQQPIAFAEPGRRGVLGRQLAFGGPRAITLCRRYVISHGLPTEPKDNPKDVPQRLATLLSGSAMGQGGLWISPGVGSAARGGCRRATAHARFQRTLGESAMRGVTFVGGRKLQVAEFPDPAPGPHDVVVEIKASGMCGSDLKFYRATGGETATLGLGKLEAQSLPATSHAGWWLRWGARSTTRPLGSAPA